MLITKWWARIEYGMQTNNPTSMSYVFWDHSQYSQSPWGSSEHPIFFIIQKNRTACLSLNISTIPKQIKVKSLRLSLLLPNVLHIAFSDSKTRLYLNLHTTFQYLLFISLYDMSLFIHRSLINIKINLSYYYLLYMLCYMCYPFECNQKMILV